MIKKLYSDAYFNNRFLNDSTRIKSFQKEKFFIQKFTGLNKNVCDVGCSTGEFLKSIKWSGFAALSKESYLPAYALGGIASKGQDYNLALKNYGFGIAGISIF